MSPDESPTVGTTPRPVRHLDPWACTVAFAAAGFVAGGWVVFSIGYRQAIPPPAPSGLGSCEVGILDDFYAMFVGVPLAAVASGILAGAVGAVIDYRRAKSGA